MAGHAQDDYGSYGSVSPETKVDGSGAGPMGVRATPEDFGGQVGEAVSKFGDNAEEVAQHYGEMAVHTAVNDQFVNGYAPQVNQLESDYKKLQGMDAVQQQPTYEQKLRDLNKQYMGAGGPLQQQYMGELVSRRSLSTMDTISNHADQQYTQHENLITQQGIKDTTDTAMNNWQNPGVVDDSIQRAIGLTKLDGIRKVGYDPESQAAVSQLAKEQGSQVAVSTIKMALDNGDAQTANAYKNKYNDIISGRDKLTLEKQISSLNISNNVAEINTNLLSGKPAITPGSPHYDAVQTKATIADLAQKNNFDPNIAFALHGAESDYGKGIKPDSRLKDDFQTDPKYRDANFADDSLASSVHNAAKIWDQNSSTLVTRLGRPTTVSENYLAYNQGGAGASALLTASPTDTAVQALSKIMPVAEAQAHVLQNGGTPTMSASDFSGHIQNLFQNHYDNQKITVTDNPAEAIRGQAKAQLPAIQQTSNPHQFFQQISDAVPNAQAYWQNVPDEKVKEAGLKQLDSQYRQAELGDKIWKNQQAETANKFGQDPRYTTMDQIPQSVKSDLQDAGQLTGLERQLTDKTNPKKDNTYGATGFLNTMERVISDDKADNISDLAGLQKAYGDTPDLHSSGFKQLQNMLKTSDTPEGKATLATQFQYLTDLRQKMVAGESDTQGLKAFDAALPRFFAAYGSAAAKGAAADIISFDPDNKNSFLSSLKLPSQAEMTNKKIQNSVGVISGLLSAGRTASDVLGRSFNQATGRPSNLTLTPQEQILADWTDGKISAQEKNDKLKEMGVTLSTRAPRAD